MIKMDGDFAGLSIILEFGEGMRVCIRIWVGDRTAMAKNYAITCACGH